PRAFRLVLADDDDLGFRQHFTNGASRLRATHLRHGHVHQDEVGSEVNRLLDSVRAVHRFATNMPFATGREEGPQATPNYLVVVHNENTQSLHSVSPHEISSIGQRKTG